MKINKALFSLALASVTLSTFPMNAFANDSKSLANVVIEEEGEMNFSDVSPNHWAYRSIRKLVEKYGVLGGFPDGTFRGNRTLTRYEAAALISKVMEKIEMMANDMGGSIDTGSGVDAGMLGKLKKEFMSELEDLEGQVKRVSKDQQDLQKDIDETRDMVEMVKGMLPTVEVSGWAASRPEVVTADWKTFSKMDPQFGFGLDVNGKMKDTMNWVHFGLGLSTGDNVNPFISMAQGNNLALSGIAVNKMYVSLGDIHKNWIQIEAGRINNPYTSTTELLFDKDLTLTGSSLRLRLGPLNNHLGVVAGYTHLGNVNGVADLNAPKMFSSSLYYKVGGHEDGWKFKLAASGHSFRNVTSPATANAAANGALAASDKTITNIGNASLWLSFWNNNISLFGDFAANLGSGFAFSTAADKIGMVAGLKLGNMKEPSILPMLGVSVKRVGKESVFDSLNEDQFSLNNTNTDALEAMIGWKLDSNSKLMATYQMSAESGKLMDNAAAKSNILRAYVSRWF